MIKCVVLEGKETLSIQIQGIRNALKGAREGGLVGKMKKFKEMKLKRLDAACSECPVKTLSHWHRGPVENIRKNELKDPERILEI